MMAILLETVHFNFAQVGGFIAPTMMLISMAFTTLGVKWELILRTETFLLNTQKFTSYQIGSISGMVKFYRNENQNKNLVVPITCDTLRNLIPFAQFKKRQKLKSEKRKNHKFSIFGGV